MRNSNLYGILSEIDVIITTRNRVHDLIYTINKLLEIGFTESQIFIIDDCSSDNTTDLVSKNYGEINITKNTTNEGLIRNRNELIKGTFRPFIFSIDDDANPLNIEDIFDPIIYLKAHDNIVVYSFKLYNSRETPPPINSKGEFKIVKTFFGGAHIMKRNVIDKVGLYFEKFEFYCEELEFSIRIFKENLFIVSNEAIVHHRIDLKNSGKRIVSVDEKKRLELGFSNGLWVIYMHYPYLIRWLFIFFYIVKRFIKYGCLKGELKSFYFGLRRFLLLRDEGPVLKKMTLSQLLKWVKI